MHLNVIPPGDLTSPDCLREALCLPGAGAVLWRQIVERMRRETNAAAQPLIPSEWLPHLDKGVTVRQSVGPEGLSPGTLNGAAHRGLLIANARLACRYDRERLNTLLDPSGSAVVAVEMAPELAAPHELVRRTSQNRIVGFRRVLEDMIEPAAFFKTHFPAVLYFPPSVVKRFGRHDCISLDFETLQRALDEKGIPMQRFRLGGRVCDLTAPEGLLYLLGQTSPDELNHASAAADVAPSARLIGPVWLGDGVRIKQNALVAGPCILCSGVEIGDGAVVRNSIIGPSLSVESGTSVHHTLVLSDTSRQGPTPHIPVLDSGKTRSAYRDWPRLSYPRLGKRIFDILFSLSFLLLISPIFPVVAMMLKLTSPGPVFYRARRQGRHGKEFACLKFRSMMVTADSLQERLRGINQVDGPQFKIDNDPRITGVGKFLRDTCIDELPQFINVLLGQMSVVGPRPSPENENDSCPAWRDARLSVRPGITGLWQVCRTRQAEMDFQEWIYYDTKYVRNLSFRQDLFICLKTADKLIHTFLDQFG